MHDTFGVWNVQSGKALSWIEGWLTHWISFTYRGSFCFTPFTCHIPQVIEFVSALQGLISDISALSIWFQCSLCFAHTASKTSDITQTAHCITLPFVLPITINTGHRIFLKPGSKEDWMAGYAMCYVPWAGTKPMPVDLCLRPVVTITYLVKVNKPLLKDST